MSNPSRPFGLTPEELEVLDRFLSSDLTGNEVMMVDTLDGYLTAIAIGPRTLPAAEWLPGIWSPKGEETPRFTSAAQADAITQLIMRHLNGLIDQFHQAPEAFEPFFDVVAYPNSEREYLDAEMWCYGFLRGLGLNRADWQALFENEEGVQALMPIYLLGTSDRKTPAQMASIKTPAQREDLARTIAAKVSGIYRFWMPYREAMHERLVATTVERQGPKVGRNDPCPCGSGKKFKKCCGLASNLH